jgi:hypothetical protein
MLCVSRKSKECSDRSLMLIRNSNRHHWLSDLLSVRPSGASSPVDS